MIVEIKSSALLIFGPVASPNGVFPPPILLGISVEVLTAAYDSLGRAYTGHRRA